VRDGIRAFIVQAARKYALPVAPPDEIELIEGAHGADALAAVVRVARLEGIVLDPRSTAKAFAGLVDALRSEPARFGRRVCFVHTGGMFGVFPYRDRVEGLTGPGVAARW
jgi:D-cysteine desulfhydrase